MTKPRAQEEQAKRGRGRPPKEQLSMAGDLATALEYVATAAKSIRWPSARYQQDPERYFVEILGVRPWSRQLEVLEAIRDYPRVAVRAGHKVSKSHTIAGVALWYYCSFDDARAILTSTTARQVDQILWREISMVKARSGRCLTCKLQDPDGRRIPAPCPHSALIDGTMGSLARTGLKSADFREIVGFTAREAEAVAGISGKNLLYLPDEASGIPDKIFEAIEGNRAGGARIAMFSNPTKNEGEFFEAFDSKSELYKTITISSEETPNVIEGRDVIPGLAGRAWIEEKKAEWGENSALYMIRVKGLHALREDGKIFSVHTITEAERLWPDAEDSGRLFLGIDPSGESGKGDECIMAPRRGNKVLSLRAFQGLTAEQILIHALAILALHKRDGDVKPVVVYDREGSVGVKLHNVIQAHVEAHPESFEAVAIKASGAAQKEPLVYDRMRDDLIANLAKWVLNGGTIPTDTKLSKELHIWEWRTQSGTGKVKLWPPKEDLRKAEHLGRSPDRCDAVALSVWEPSRLAEAAVAQNKPAAPQDIHVPVIDPYAGAEAFR